MTLYQLLCKLCDGQKIMIEAYSGPITAPDFVIYQGNFRVFEKLDPKLNPIYRGNDFATADALLISNIDGNLTFHFVEFKNMDYEKEKDVKMSKYWLKECISEMKECEHECF